MTDGHGRIALEQQHRHRFADDLASANDHRVRAGDTNRAAFEYLDYPGRRARHEMRTSLHELSDIDRVKPVDIFRRIDGIKHLLCGPLPHRRWQRRLYQDAVMDATRIQPVDEVQQLSQ